MQENSVCNYFFPSKLLNTKYSMILFILFSTTGPRVQHKFDLRFSGTNGFLTKEVQLYALHCKSQDTNNYT